MTTDNCSITYATLHDTIFLPGPGGKGVNLKATLDTTSVEGVSQQLKMTLMGSMVYIEAKGARGLLPLTNFKLLIPSEG